MRKLHVLSETLGASLLSPDIPSPETQRLGQAVHPSTLGSQAWDRRICADLHPFCHDA